MHPVYQKAAGLTETIIAAAIEVHRNKGPGLIESIYEWCMRLVDSQNLFNRLSFQEHASLHQHIEPQRLLPRETLYSISTTFWVTQAKLRNLSFLSTHHS